MTKVYAALAAILTLLFIIGGLYAWGRQGHQKAQEAQETARVIATQRDGLKTALDAAKEQAKKDRRILDQRAQRAEELRKQAERRTKELEDAIKANPGWASQPVPDSVWDAITGIRPDARPQGTPEHATGLPNP